MEFVLIILLLINIALLCLIVLFATTAIGVLRKSVEDSTQEVESRTTPTTPPKEEAKDEEVEEDKTVPLEQFTPDFSKPIKIKDEEEDPIEDLNEIDDK